MAIGPLTKQTAPETPTWSGCSRPWRRIPTRSLSTTPALEPSATWDGNSADGLVFSWARPSAPACNRTWRVPTVTCLQVEARQVIADWHSASAKSLKLVSAGAAQCPDASLGCPEAGKADAQAITPRASDNLPARRQHLRGSHRQRVQADAGGVRRRDLLLNRTGLSTLRNTAGNHSATSQRQVLNMVHSGLSPFI